jgi:hypothetical protein
MTSSDPFAYTDPGTYADPAGLPWVPYILLILLLMVGAVVLWFLHRRRRAYRLAQMEKVALKVILPKQHKPEEERRDPKEVIGVMEPLIAILHHYYQDNWQERFWRGQPTFSFEIVAHDGEIFFYLVCPAAFADQLERQVHAQYPSAHIERAYDLDIFLEKEGESACAALQLVKPYIFPIRTYRYLENDPLNALTNSLSKVQQGRAVIQILIQPTEQNWHSRIQEALHNVQQGRQFEHSQGMGNKLASLAKEVGQTAFANPNPEEAQNPNDALNTAKANVRLTAMQEQQAKMLTEKAGKVGFKVQIRCAARAKTEIEARNQVQNMLSAFAQYQAPELNGFRINNLYNRNILVDYVLRAFSPKQPAYILNTEEIASLFHFPNLALETPNIHWLGARRLPPPTNLPRSGLLLGYSQYRGAQVPVYIQPQDRSRHLYMVGMTGVGKTTIFENMILQDIRNGEGVCYMDPNGDAIEWILRHIPKERAEDVILFDPSDTTRPLALNLLEYDPRFPEQKTMVINEMISIFDKLYDLKQTGGPIFEQYMRNAMLLVMDDPKSGSTLMEIPKVLADPEFRKLKLSKTQNQVVHDFWVKEAEKAGGEAALANIVPYVTSKLTQFTSNDIMRPIIGQQNSAFNFREVMDRRKILLVSLPKGLLGEMNAMLLGMIISGKIQIAAFSRQNIAESERVPFYMYVDEFQNFTSKTFATILSEARKYRLALNITNQYIEQLDEQVRSAIFGNVGTVLTWRVGPTDAEFLAKQFEPLLPDDLINTEKYNYYLKLLIDNAPSRPFNAAAYGPDPHENIQVGEAIRQLSRLKYGRDREVIEAEIRSRAQLWYKV